ncbi:MAG: DUF1338 domain-containing protein [Planctomycetaceae bacterium]|jgi:hypothetical protein|nr:DUF1338 domain-containing protein [Planctomycetaceae bacterium]
MTNIDFLHELFARLLITYRELVSYVRDYEQVVNAAGGTFVNDHIAFRTFAWQQPAAGISAIARPFEALGYRAAACYQFPEKHLAAQHLEPPAADLPKLFISELQTWQLDEASRNRLARSLDQHRPPLATGFLQQLAHVEENPDQGEELLETLLAHLQRRPWPAPDRSDVLSVSGISQYAAWVLLHGYNVNHFTALINAHGVEELATIEKTVEALSLAGVPMKAKIEGAAGSRLRQTTTEAVVIDVEVTDEGQSTTMPWTYAYLELAERGQRVDPDTGKSGRFEGFLGPQATHLFEMTRRT